jgi:lysophospholipid acyltransferase (LPLAT)-like uncharacterized protein
VRNAWSRLAFLLIQLRFQRFSDGLPTDEEVVFSKQPHPLPESDGKRQFVIKPKTKRVTEKKTQVNKNTHTHTRTRTQAPANKKNKKQMKIYKKLPSSFYTLTSPLASFLYNSYITPLINTCAIKTHHAHQTHHAHNTNHTLHTTHDKSDASPKPAIHTLYHQHLPFLIPYHGSCTANTSNGRMAPRTLLIQGDAYMTPVVHYVQSTGMRVVRGGGKFDSPVIDTLKEVVESGGSCVLAVDGPSGPCYKIKKGAILLAQQTGCPIIHSYYKTKKAVNDDTRWDKRLIPCYFDEIDVYVGEERYVGEEECVEDVIHEMEEKWRDVLERDALERDALK